MSCIHWTKCPCIYVCCVLCFHDTMPRPQTVQNCQLSVLNCTCCVCTACNSKDTCNTMSLHVKGFSAWLFL